MKRVWLLIVMMLIAGLARAEETLILGVQEYVRSPIQVAYDYKSLADYLGRVLNKTVRIESVKSYDQYMKKVAAKRFAFIFAPPSMVIQGNKSAGYVPVAKFPGLIAASFIAMSKSGIAFPEDMKDKRVGFYEKNAMVTQLGMAYLSGEGINPATYFKSVTYYMDFNDVLTAMQHNLIDVGVCNSTLFNAWSSRGNDLNLIAQGKGVPHLTFALRGDFPESVKATITKAILEAHKDVDGRAFLDYAKFPSFEPAQLSDYEDMVKTLTMKKS